jgi:histidinol-phosphatase (PHP family)
MVFMLTGIVDSHVHSRYSPDSSISLEDGITVAQQMGLSGLAFTDHYELEWAKKQSHKTSWMENFESLIQERATRILELQERMEKDFLILQGIELGIEPQFIDELNNFMSLHEFDCVLASVHAIDGLGVHEPGFFDGKEKHNVLVRYLEEVLYKVTHFDNYDVVAHIGYVQRFIPFEDKNMYYTDYRDLVDEIFKNIIQKNKALEINCAGFRRGLGMPHPGFDFLERYFELGGRMVTVGSDSHEPEAIGKNFMLVLEKLKDIGFPYVAHFKQREPLFCKIR